MHLHLLSLFLAFGTFAAAQESRPVKCRFLAFMVKEPKAGIMAVSANSTSPNFPLPTTHLSKPVICFAENNIIRFVNETGGQVIAKAAIPAGVTSAFLIFIPATATRATASMAETSPAPATPLHEKDTSPSWRVFVIADTPENFPDGGIYIANFYSGTIRFTVGEHKGLLKAGGAHGYKLPKKVDEFNMAPAVFELQKGDKWRCASESALRFLPGMRYLVFAYQDPASGRPRINTYQHVAEHSAIPSDEVLPP